MISVCIYIWQHCDSTVMKQNMKSSKEEIKVKKGAWTEEEDLLLTKCIQHFGEGNWKLVPHRAGLNRCRKSCRMRWLNYLQPNVKRGYFDPAEIDLVQRMHKLLGNRWSLIAGRIPGRTANDVKNFWNSHICKKHSSPKQTTNIIKPLPRNLTLVSKTEDNNTTSLPSSSSSPSPSPLLQEEDCSQWWRDLLQMSGNGLGTAEDDRLLNVGLPPEYGDGTMNDLFADFHAWDNTI